MILLVAIALFTAGWFSFYVLPLASILIFVAPLFFVYGLAYLIVCLAARKRAGMPIRIWKFQTSLVSLISTSCVLVFLLWSRSMALKEIRNSAWDFLGGQYIHASDKRDAPIFEAVERGINEKLVSPSSAKFETIAQIIYDSEKGDDLAYVRLEVDSQNKYGAMIHSKWQVELRRYKLDKDAWWRASNVKMIETSEK